MPKKIIAVPPQVETQKFDKQSSDFERQDDVDKRINTVLAKDIREKDKNVLESFLDFFNKKGTLTPGQYKWFCIIEKSYSEEALKKQQDFANNLSAQEKEDFTILLEIIKKENTRNHTRYYASVIEKFETSGIFPDEEYFHKIMNNKFSAGKLRNWKQEPKYKSGQLVEFRSNTKRYFPPEAKTTCIVVKPNADYPFSHAKDAKVYSVIHIESQKELIVEEREIKALQ